jgi:transposase
MANLFWFSDEQWARIAPLLPTDREACRGSRIDACFPGLSMH